MEPSGASGRVLPAGLVITTLQLLGALFSRRQACIDKAVADTVDLHVVASPLLCQRLRQTRYACLGRRIIRLPRVPVHARNRGYIHHLARIGAPVGSLLFLSRVAYEL